LLVAVLVAVSVQTAHGSEPAATLDASGEPIVVRHPPSSVRLPLVLGGLGITAAAYGASALAATTWDDVPGADAMLVPVAGPWISLAQNDCAPDDPDCGAILYLRGILLVLDGLVQLGGLGIAAEGFFMTTEATAPPKKASWQLTPIVSAPSATGLGMTGLSLTGTF